MIDCSKKYSISQWDWSSSVLHSRFVWGFDDKCFYTDDDNYSITHDNLLRDCRGRLRPRLTFIME